MKLRNAFRLSVILLVLVMFSMPLLNEAKAQQPIQASTTAKYVKTAEDTVKYTSVATRTGIITNQSASKNLIVYFSDRYGAKLANSYVIVPPEKTLRFNCLTYKIFRHAESDSVFSQVILGDLQLNRIEKQVEGSGKHFTNENNRFVNWNNQLIVNDQKYLKPIRYSYKFPM